MDPVLVDHSDDILTLTLNEPDTLNAMSATLAQAFLEAVEFAADPAQSFRCLVITGAGRGFCSGGNVGMMSGDGNGGRIRLATHHHRVMQLLRDLPYPIITAVNGPAAGLGFSYALAGDLIVAARSAFFLAAFRNIGVTPDGGLSWTLPRIVGWARAKELLLLGERLPAEQALEWGLVNRVFEDAVFAAEVRRLACEVAAGPTAALATMRRLAWQAWQQDFDAQLAREEALQLEAFATRDAREGALAMLEKRKPRFTGD